MCKEIFKSKPIFTFPSIYILHRPILNFIKKTLGIFMPIMDTKSTSYNLRLKYSITLHKHKNWSFEKHLYWQEIKMYDELSKYLQGEQIVELYKIMIKNTNAFYSTKDLWMMWKILIGFHTYIQYVQIFVSMANK